MSAAARSRNHPENRLSVGTLISINIAELCIKYTIYYNKNIYIGTYL